jgi:hypothetical protein
MDDSMQVNKNAFAVLSLTMVRANDAGDGLRLAGAEAWKSALLSARLEEGLIGALFLEPQMTEIGDVADETWQMPMTGGIRQSAAPLQAALEALNERHVSIALVSLQGLAPDRHGAVVLCREALHKSQRLPSLGRVVEAVQGGERSAHEGIDDGFAALLRTLPAGYRWETCREPIGREGDRDLHLLAFSAASATALDTLHQAARADLERATRELPLADLAFSVHLTRLPAIYRSYVVARDIEHARGLLAASMGARVVDGPVRWAWLCTDAPIALQAARELYESHPDIRQLFNQCDHRLRPILKESILDAMFGLATDHPRGMLLETTAFMVAMGTAHLLRQWGMRPAAVGGGRLGLIAAMHAAGACDVATAIDLVAHVVPLLAQAQPAQAQQLEHVLRACPLDVRHAAGVVLGAVGQGDPSQWLARQLVEPVPVERLISQAGACGCATVLDLAGTETQAGSDEGPQLLNALASQGSAWTSLCQLAGQAWVGGCDVDLLAWDKGFVRMRVPVSVVHGLNASATADSVRSVEPVTKPVSILAGAKGLSGQRMRRALVESLTRRISEVIGIPLEQALPDKKFFTLGMQSLHAVTLTREIETETGRDLGNTLLFEHPTIERLAAFLCSHVQAEVAQILDLKAPVQPNAVVASEALSGDALRAALVSELLT